MIVDNIIYAGGAVASGGSGGGGTSVSAVNKTGATINKDSKVYMNTESGQKKIYQVGYNPLGIFPNGKMAIVNNELYDVSNWTFTKIKDLYLGSDLHIITDKDLVLAVNNETVIKRASVENSWAVDHWNTNILTRYFRGGYVLETDRATDQAKISKVNKETGETLYDVTFKITAGRYLFKIKDKLYETGGWAGENKVYKIEDTGSELKVTPHKDRYSEYDFYEIFGFTPDDKYIISAGSNKNVDVCQYDYKTDTFTKVPLSSIPVLAKWENISIPKIYYRQETGILTVCKEENNQYGFYKYHKGTFTELNIKIPDYKPDKLAVQLILSDDETKFSYAYQSPQQWNSESHIASTKPIESYNLVDFANINNTVLTGVANEEIAPDATGKVSVLLPKV